MLGFVLLVRADFDGDDGVHGEVGHDVGRVPEQPCKAGFGVGRGEVREGLAEVVDAAPDEVRRLVVVHQVRPRHRTRVERGEVRVVWADGAKLAEVRIETQRVLHRRRQGRDRIKAVVVARKNIHDREVRERSRHNRLRLSLSLVWRICG